jgi:hypothetical protein
MPRVKLSEQLEQEKQRYEQLQRIMNLLRYNPSCMSSPEAVDLSKPQPIPYEQQLLALTQLEKIANSENEKLKAQLSAMFAELMTTKAQLEASQTEITALRQQLAQVPPPSGGDDDAASVASSVSSRSRHSHRSVHSHRSAQPPTAMGGGMMMGGGLMYDPENPGIPGFQSQMGF